MDKWTIGLSTTSNIKNAQTFIKKSPYKYSLAVNKVKNRYQVNYGLYDSYREAKRDLPAVKNKGAYIRKIKAEKKFTIGLSTTSSYKNARAFVNRYFNKYSSSVSINKVKNKYLVNYGVFKSYKEAKRALSALGSKKPFKGGYIRSIIVAKDHQSTKKNIKASLKKADKKANVIKKEIYYVSSSELQKTNSTSANGFEPLKESEKKDDEIKEEMQSASSTESQNTNSFNQFEPFVSLDENTTKEDEPKEEEKAENKKEDLFKPALESKTKSIFGIGIEYSPVFLEGDFKFINSSSTVNLKDDRGIDEFSGSVLPNLYYKRGKHKIFANYMGTEYTSEHIIDKVLDSSDLVYKLGEKVDTDIETNIFTTGYRYNYKSFDVGLDYYNISSKLSFVNSVSNMNIDLDYDIYALGLDKEYLMSRFLVSFGLGYGMGKDISLYNYYLSAGIKDPYIDDSSISLGYKAKVFDITDDQYDAELQYNGFYINFNKEF